MSDLAPGNYFWRVRALHGDVFGPWSSGVPFRVVAAPPTPPGLDLFWFVTQPGSVSGGRSTQGRVTLNAPAPAGGAVVRIASDLPHTEVPESVFIPAGADRCGGVADHERAGDWRDHRKHARRVRRRLGAELHRDVADCVQPRAQHGLGRRRQLGHRHDHVATAGAGRRGRSDAGQRGHRRSCDRPRR